MQAGQFFKEQACEIPLAMPNTVVVSRDMRPHSKPLAEALIDGLRTSKVDVIDVGMCDTSFIYFAINHLGCLGGIQTTASHNPVEYNGFKISGQQAKPIGRASGLRDIQRMAESVGQRPSTAAMGQLEQRDLWSEYKQHILKFLDGGSRKLKVFIDASNGMAGKMVPIVFDDVSGLDIVRLNFEVTGSFVHEPNPLVAENMKPTQDGVVEHGADFGVCFDGDADRCILTDEKGVIIGCDHLTALLAEYFLDQSAGASVLYDLRSSKTVPEAIGQHGGQSHRSRVGHVFMKALLRETDGIFGGELSGHFYFRDNFFADSGAIAFAAVVSVLSHSQKPISELIAPYKRYPQSGEINFRVADKDRVIETLKNSYIDRSDQDNLDGITIDAWDRNSAPVKGALGGGWWFNVRSSNTEPLLRLNAEAKDQNTLDQLLNELKPILGSPDAGH